MTEADGQVKDLQALKRHLVDSMVFARASAHEDTTLAIQAALDRVNADIRAVETSAEGAQS